MLDSSLIHYLYNDLEPATSHYYAIFSKESHLKQFTFWQQKNIVSMKSIISHFSARKTIYLYCSFYITNHISSILLPFFHLPVPEAALLKVIYHISLLSSSVLVWAVYLIQQLWLMINPVDVFVWVVMHSHLNLILLPDTNFSQWWENSPTRLGSWIITVLYSNVYYMSVNKSQHSHFPLENCFAEIKPLMINACLSSDLTGCYLYCSCFLFLQRVWVVLYVCSWTFLVNFRKQCNLCAICLPITYMIPNIW